MKIPISAAGGPMKKTDEKGLLMNPYYNVEFLTVAQAADLLASVSTQLAIIHGMAARPPEISDEAKRGQSD